MTVMVLDAIDCHVVHAVDLFWRQKDFINSRDLSTEQEFEFDSESRL